ncbi:ead/Ea22-like family protein [Enterobacter hormaechei subsp. xiangfangensis]|uniref:ead/Ea22-like family protein n=1 Tax=Enterobacter cloacae complex TaxID=354276 RepID=UPI000EF9A502|nr:ead/Ea22-like family protein [Enterobacter hormaechei]EKW7976190.1 ead/Ea22-like family protein [Enterobacter hormaechei]ELD3491429.1 ead/Ea22-like family protein [Enterobacter hormaechei]MDX7383243.1 ead/Ea22-like family protein [Enterobacter hormaechei]RLZ74786.1 ead/Ea22-like family protein [Enterobacter hormaechei]WKA97965.1 ead/Ea22-like family protein [Enterobacter hormaechei]
MSNIDKQALREAAEKATKGQWAVEFDDEIYSTDGVNNEQIAMVFSENEERDAAFIAAANPATVLALLDELEALKLANAAQDDHINQQQDRIDLLEKGNNEAARQINSWRRLAKQNIAEREKDVSELNIARKRIAELEAREVVLPSTQDVHPLGPQSAKIFCEFHRSIVNRCADEIRKVGVKVSIKGN